MIDPSPIITPAFQLLSAVASVGRVRTKSYVVSRRFNALALGAVAADFAIKYLSTGRADHLVGLVVFTILTARTLMILCFESIEAEVFRRRVTCAVAFFACGVASVASQLAATGSLALVTLLPLVGIGMGCLGVIYSVTLAVRRKFYLREVRTLTTWEDAHTQLPRLLADNDHCELYAICQQEAPEVFDLGIDGRLRYDARPGAEHTLEVRQAARCCPMQAITLTQEIQ